jgi:epoxide hydrolase-like predicted phosphatase
MQIRAVLFDIGGILEITPPTGWRERWESTLGLGPGELDERMSDVWRDGAVGKITEADVEAAIRQRLGVRDDQMDRFQTEMWDDYLGSPNVELIDYFTRLRPRYRTGIISNSFVGARRREQEGYGFGDICKLIVYSHEVGVDKPDRRIYDLTCERMALQPGECVFLDDVEENVVAAREVGFHAVLFANNAQAINDIEVCLRSP